MKGVTTGSGRRAVLLAHTALLLGVHLIAASARGAESLADLLAAKRFAEALKAADSLIKVNSTDPRLWTARGMALSGLNRIEDGFASYDRALKFQPSFLPALRARAESAYGSRHARTEFFVRQLLQTDPASEPAHAMAAVLAFEARDCRDAVSHFRASPGQLRGNGVATSQFGHCLLELGLPVEAALTFEHQLERAPQNVSARYNLAVAQLQAHPDAAMKTLEPLTGTRDAEDASGRATDALATLRIAVSVASAIISTWPFSTRRVGR